MKANTTPYALALWLAALWLVGGTAVAQSNSIEKFEVAEQAGKVVVRITTKEPLRSVPPNFAVASPARIALDFANTVNALGRATQDIGQGELRSMNIVQGGDRTRLVLNLRRPVTHEASVDGRVVTVTLTPPAVAQTGGAPVAHFAEGKGDAKHAIRDIDFAAAPAARGA